MNISDNLEKVDDISYELNIDICSIEEDENENFNIHIPEDYKNEIEKSDNIFKIQNDDLKDLD